MEAFAGGEPFYIRRCRGPLPNHIMRRIPQQTHALAPSSPPLPSPAVLPRLADSLATTDALCALDKVDDFLRRSRDAQLALGVPVGGDDDEGDGPVRGKRARDAFASGVVLEGDLEALPSGGRAMARNSRRRVEQGYMSEDSQGEGVIDAGEKVPNRPRDKGLLDSFSASSQDGS